jgi:hypothetical protein
MISQIILILGKADVRDVVVGSPCLASGPGFGVNIPMLVAIHDAWHDRVGVGTGADDEEDHEKERLKVEKRRLE